MPLANNPNAQSNDLKWCIPPLLRRLCATVGGKVEAAFEETQPHLPAIMPADRLSPGESLGYHAVVRHLVSGERCELFVVADEIRSIHRLARVPRRSTLARDSNFALQMTTSADLLRDLHSAHLVKIIANGLTNEKVPRPYVIMERLAGRNLAVYLRRHGRLDESFAVEVGIQVAKAISVLHRTGLTNPELHPGSVMLAHIAGDHFVLKLTGVERVRRMQSAPAGGTSPEVLEDLRGLGELLVHLLTGAPTAKVVGGGDPLTEVKAEIMPDFAMLLHRLTSRDTRDLPTSVEEVLQALRSIQGSLAEASCVAMLRRPPTPTVRTSRRDRNMMAARFATEDSGRDELSFGELSLLMPTLRPLSPLKTSGAPRGVRVAASLLMACVACVLGMAVAFPCSADTSVRQAAAVQDSEEVHFAQRPITVAPYVLEPLAIATPLDRAKTQVEEKEERDRRATKRQGKKTSREVNPPAELPTVEDLDDDDDVNADANTTNTAPLLESDDDEAIPELLEPRDTAAEDDARVVDELLLDFLPLHGGDYNPRREDLITRDEDRAALYPVAGGD